MIASDISRYVTAKLGNYRSLSSIRYIGEKHMCMGGDLQKHALYPQQHDLYHQKCAAYRVLLEGNTFWSARANSLPCDRKLCNDHSIAEWTLECPMFYRPRPQGHSQGISRLLITSQHIVWHLRHPLSRR